jgi:RNA polymerase sigma factor (sigma-70 family)
VTPDAVDLAAEHHRFAVAVARRIIRDPDDARSLAGWAICQAAQEWVDRGHVGEFRTWAATFVRRRAVDETRRQFGRRGQRLAVVQPQSFADPIGDGITLEGALADPADDYLTVEDRLDAQRRAVRVRKAIDGRLSPGRARVARRLGEASQADLAVEFGVTPSRICQIVADVRAALSDLADSGPAVCRSSGTPFTAGPDPTR